MLYLGYEVWRGATSHSADIYSYLLVRAAPKHTHKPRSVLKRDRVRPSAATDKRSQGSQEREHKVPEYPHHQPGLADQGAPGAPAV